MKIAFFGRSFGEIVRDKLKESGYELVDSQKEEADLMVVGFYGKILPKEMLEKPKFGALNVHPSLLPKHRGSSPVQTTIFQGEKETGVTIIKMDEEVDHGPILAQRTYVISGNPTTPELEKILWTLGGNLLVEILPKWIAGKIIPQEQDHTKATYTKKLGREAGRIDWSKPALYIERQIRAFTPWPGTYILWKEKRVKILKAHIEREKLVIDELQIEGKKPTTFRDFLLGHKDFVLPFER